MIIVTMNLDPKGYYARLGVDLDAAPAELTAAYRRKARVLHPDIPITGDAAAFVAVKEAYDVLADPLRRAAYDRSARAVVRTPAPAEIVPEPPPPMHVPRTRGPRLSDQPIAVWVGLAVVAAIAGIEALTHLASSPEPAPTPARPMVTANAPTVTPAPPPQQPAPVRLAGTPNTYVVPAGGGAMIWRHDPAHDGMVPAGQLPPFSAVQALRVIRQNGLVEIRLNETETGFIDASRLTPGNAAAARQAFCAYNAGPAPANGEVLTRNGSGPATVHVENHSAQPMVVKFRESNGTVAASVFLEPSGETDVTGLPPGPYRPDYAIGELWSRACHRFAAGMRAERFARFVDLPSSAPLTVPPALAGRPEPMDIPDQAFEQE